MHQKMDNSLINNQCEQECSICDQWVPEGNNFQGPFCSQVLLHTAVVDTVRA